MYGFIGAGIQCLSNRVPLNCYFLLQSLLYNLFVIQFAMGIGLPLLKRKFNILYASNPMRS